MKQCNLKLLNRNSQFNTHRAPLNVGLRQFQLLYVTDYNTFKNSGTPQFQTSANFREMFIFHLNHEFKLAAGINASANHSFASLLILTATFHVMTQGIYLSVFAWLILLNKYFSLIRFVLTLILSARFGSP